MENQYYNPPPSKPTTLAVFGFGFAILSVLFMPILFMPLAILCALAYMFRPNANIEVGVLIIVLAGILGVVGAMIGGWGLGLPKLHMN